MWSSSGWEISPVYTVKPETRAGPTRTLHRDLLLPCGFLPVSTLEDLSVPAPVHKPKSQSQARNHHDPTVGLEEEETDPAMPDCSGPLLVQLPVKPERPCRHAPLSVLRHFGPCPINGTKYH